MLIVMSLRAFSASTSGECVIICFYNNDTRHMRIWFREVFFNSSSMADDTRYYGIGSSRHIELYQIVEQN